MWIKVDQKKLPILSMVDMATKYQVAALVTGERSDHLIHAIERCWIRHFGLPLRLWTDEAVGGAVITLLNGLLSTTSSMKLLLVKLTLDCPWSRDDTRSCGKPSKCSSMTCPFGVKQAITYVIPQLNASPTVAWFSPSQWFLGKQPTVAGELLWATTSILAIPGGDFPQQNPYDTANS